MLDDELLGELEARWSRQGAFVARALRPGLTDDQIDALTLGAGLSLPAEARRWWGWHDGADPQVPRVAAELGPGRAFLPLADAVSECLELRQLMHDVSLSTDTTGWKESWLPIDAHKRPILFDCGVADSDPVPVRSYFMEDPTAGAPGVRSIGELVLVWIASMDCGAWSYDRDRDHWDYDWAKLPTDLAVLHLT